MLTKFLRSIRCSLELAAREEPDGPTARWLRAIAERHPGSPWARWVETIR